MINAQSPQMRILLTGATGYIAQRLLPVLLRNGHEVICCVRDKVRFDSEKYRSSSYGAGYTGIAFCLFMDSSSGGC